VKDLYDTGCVVDLIETYLGVSKIQSPVEPLLPEMGVSQGSIISVTLFGSKQISIIEHFKVV